MIKKTGDTPIICPVLGALVEEGTLKPDAGGTVTQRDLYVAFTERLRMRPDLALVTATSGEIGNRPADVLRNFLTHLFRLDRYQLHLDELPSGMIKHNYDSLVLTGTDGRPDPARFDELASFAETGVAQDGTTIKVMTAQSYRRAIDARFERDRTRPGSATKGVSFALVEAEALVRVLGELTVDELRALYFDRKLPERIDERRKAVGLESLIALIPETAKRLPRAAAEDFRRIASVALGLFASPTGSHTGRALHGTKLALGDPPRNGVEPALKGIATAAGCPAFGGTLGLHQRASRPDEQILHPHANLVATADRSNERPE